MDVKLSKEFDLLNSITKTFSESLDLEKTLESIFRLIEKHLKLQHAAISLLNSENETIQIKLSHGFSKAEEKLGTYQLGEGITGMVVESGKEYIVKDIKKDPQFLNRTKRMKGNQRKKISFFCVPIKLEGKTIGALSVDKEVLNDSDFRSDVRLLNVVATLIAQPIKLNKLVENDRKKLNEENLKLKHDLKTKFNVHNVIGCSNAMKEVYRLIEQVAKANTTVLLRGESGTGKDLVAHSVHYNSLRESKPFIKVNCTALPETLLESELFGHEKGAFTDAKEHKKGRFELANGGTIFLDEIGDFPVKLQVKLLRVIQFKEFERIGGTKTIQTDVRIIVATNKNLEQEIKLGGFREDLYYRINVFPIFLPPLRNRKDDIMLLCDYFLEKHSRENRKTITRISTPAINMITSYHWPGNIRELENCIERAVLLCNDDVIRSEQLPPSLQISKDSLSSGQMTFNEIIANKEIELIIDALKRNKGQQRSASRDLGISERILGYKIKNYNISCK